MSTAVHHPCPSCGTPFADHQRYCLRCGELVGERSVDLERAWALARAEDAPALASEAEADAAVPAATGATSLWRRPVASLLTGGALAVGTLGGFLLGPAGSSADHGRTPVLLGALGNAAAASTATPAGTDATPATTDAPPATDAGATDLTPAATTADDTATPSAADDTTTAAADDTTTAADDTSTSSDDVSDDTDAGGDGSQDLSGLVDAAGALPPIDHVWVISVTGQDAEALFGDPHGYLSDALVARGTLLSKYTPAADTPSADAKTLVDQLAEKGTSWRAYAEDAAAPRNPFADKADGVVGLDRLATDLQAQDTTPAFSYIIPAPADDGSTGTGPLDAFLERVVAPIRRTDAYKKGGLIAIVPDAPAATATGALLLSPFAAGATAVDTALAPGNLLKTFEALFDLDAAGAAAGAGVKALGSDVLAKP
jgi:hypothetical protein